MHFLDGYSIRAALSPLSQSEIIEAALPVVIERGIIKTREDLYLIIAGLPSSTQVKIREAALAKQALGVQSLPPVTTFVPPTKQRSEQLTSRLATRFDNVHLQEKTCFICAGRYPRSEVLWLQVTADDHGALLSPQSPHPSHNLHCGMLLHTPAVRDFGIRSASGNACMRCSTRIDNGETPPLALANAMWVGEMPPQLARLGIIERIVIARSFTAFYLIEVDCVKQSPLEYKICPQPPSSTLDSRASASVPLPYGCLPDLIRVQVMGELTPDVIDLLSVDPGNLHAALIWLQDNNPLYHDTIIDTEILAEYSARAIPDNIIFSHICGSLADFVLDNTLDHLGFELFGNPLDPRFNCALLEDPCTSPFGVGPLSNNRLIPVSLKDRVAHCLRYHDQRFNTTAFIKRSSWYIQEIQVRRATSICSGILRTPRRLELSDEDISTAMNDERAGRPYTSPTITSSVYDAQAVMSEICGTRASYSMFPSNIRDLCLLEGPPSLHIRLGPIDHHHPGIRSFCDAYGYDGNDHTATAKIFAHLTKYAMLDLFSIQSVRGHVRSDIGIFGKLSAYVTTTGTTDAGSLVMDTFLWLQDTPSHIDMQDLLAEQSFRSALATYLGDVLDLDGDQAANPADLTSILATFRDASGHGAWVDEDGLYGLGDHDATRSPHISRNLPINHSVRFFTHGPNVSDNVAADVEAIVDSQISDPEARPITYLSNHTLAGSDPFPLRTDEEFFTSFATHTARTIPIPPQLIAFSLLGNATSTTSHTMVPIYLDAILYHLRWHYSNLLDNIDSSDHSLRCGMEQYTDYSRREPAFENLNLLDYLLGTTTVPVNCYDVPVGISHADRVRIRRGDTFKAAPRILSSLFRGRVTKTGHYHYRCASLIILLKPWRHPKDILEPSTSFVLAFSHWSQTASPKVKYFLDNLEYLAASGLFALPSAKL